MKVKMKQNGVDINNDSPVAQLPPAEEAESAISRMLSFTKRYFGGHP